MLLGILKKFLEDIEETFGNIEEVFGGY